jgi:hypothetical protein
MGDEGIDAIVDGGLLSRLKVLDLRHGCVTDAGARRLAACPDARKLESLDLSRNEMTADGIATLERAGLRALTQHQHGSTAGEDDPQYMYEGDYE